MLQILVFFHCISFERNQVCDYASWVVGSRTVRIQFCIIKNCFGISSKKLLYIDLFT